MKTSMLQEYINKVGIVTREEMIERTGVARHSLVAPFASLINEKSIFTCRFAHGSITYLSLHLVFCIRAVMCEQPLSSPAQDLLDLLSDQEESSTHSLFKAFGSNSDSFTAALQELQQKMAIVPIRVIAGPEGQPQEATEEQDSERMFWCTADYWLKGIYKASRYSDVGYCLSEMRRLLQGHFSTREINNFLYRSNR